MLRSTWKSGEGRVAEQFGALDPQRRDPRDRLVVVELVAVVTAGQVGVEDLLAQAAVGRGLEERPDARGLQRVDPLALEAGGPGGVGADCDYPLGQAGELLLRVEHQFVGVGLLEDVVGELHRQRGHLLVDRAHPLLLFRTEQGAGAHEVGVGLLEQARLLGVELERRARFPHRLDAGKQRGVEADVVAMSGELRSELLLDRLQRLVGLGRGQVRKHRVDLVEQLPRVVERLKRVGKRCRRLITGDRRDFLRLGGHRLGQRGREVLGADRRERRHTERRRPLDEQRIGLGGRLRDGRRLCRQARHGERDEDGYRDGREGAREQGFACHAGDLSRGPEAGQTP
jgi:hypothetical protein